MKKQKVNVMGTDYTVVIGNKNKFILLERNDGYIAPEKKLIVLDEQNNPVHQKHVLTHELVHAFLYESGLDVESWGNNEEIVDWIAIQLEKMASTILNATKSLNKKEKSND